MTIITFAIPLFQQFQWIIILRCFQGLAAATFAPVALALVVDKYSPKKMVTTIGFISSSFLISGIVGQLFSSYIAQQLGWAYVFYYSGIIYLFTVLVVLFLIPKTDIKQTDNNWRDMVGGFLKLFKKRGLIYAYTITITLLLSFVAYYTILGEYLTEIFMLGEDNILYVRLVGIIGMLFAPFAGILSNRLGLLPILRGGLFLATLGVILSGISTNIYFVVSSSVVFVTGIALTVPTLISLVGKLGGRNHGIAVSLYAFILFVGASLGPIVAVTIMNIGNNFMTFILLASIIIISLVVSFLLRGDYSTS
ncbi:putative MFS family arabinose efflux permease [Gracilibacillus halotolerans]|uniref:Putative MFS family arabinose efflux permease n=1 Tax=Gracilibacillus halotolerans TaxID=74386 RepID=A0A841RSK5_9BACI|nr:putative MFS family arabinose efflux permease [Gracilibacillus halotolerans]